MTLNHFFILAGAAFFLGIWRTSKLRLPMLVVSSVIGVYWFEQFNKTIPALSFWLPTATIALTLLIWTLIVPDKKIALRQNWNTLLLVGITVIGVAATRFLSVPNPLLREMLVPRMQMVVVFLLALGIFGGILLWARAYTRIFVWGAFLALLAIFVLLKSPFLNRILSDQIGASSKTWIVWLGYSYFAFRIIHTLREHQKGIEMRVSLAEYLVYVTFFPAFMAGPIDRLPRFLQDLRTAERNSDADWLDALVRLAWGLFKKFVLADSLARFALSPELFPFIQGGARFWLALYAYTFQIYFDFSGYTDIAIGTGRLIGIQLPENFAAPYRKPNLTQFWNSWHITLTQWFRAYFFNPLQRTLRRNAKKLPIWALILFLQLATMTLIGLWHGIVWNFVLWGLWHGFGLFVHNRWRDAFGAKVAAWADTRQKENLLNMTGIFLTFHYVAVGWIFFTLPDRMILPALQLMLGLIA